MVQMTKEFKDLSVKIFQLAEIRQVLEFGDAKRSRRNEMLAANAWLNLVSFRLTTCCGLRGCEVRQLRLDDFLLGGSRPVIRIRKEATKGMLERRRTRLVPLWWDRGTYDDIADFVRWRRLTRPADAVAVLPDFDTRPQMQSAGEFMCRKKFWRRWKRLVEGALGEDRKKQLSPHAGRHTFCTHSLMNGRSLAQVRDAAGHADIQTTNIYLHALETGEELPDIFPEEDDVAL